jgi:hypothetical protein
VRRLCALVIAASAAALALPAVAAASGFQNIAAQAGIAQNDQSFNTLVFDQNGDGIQDFLYSPQNDKTGRQLWRGNADGTFTLVSHLKSASTSDQHGCATADFDQNGLPDVYCAMGAIYGSRVKANPLWLQQPGGSWKLNEASGAQDAYGRGYSAAALDANGDGWPDLFVDNNSPRPDGVPTPDRLFINRGDDAGGSWLGFADAGPASGVEQNEGDRGCDFSTDFNGDGRPDIVFCGKARMFFYQSNGDGSFTDVSVQKVGSTGLFASDAKLADINADGLLDLIYIKNAQQGVRLGTATGTFAKASLTHAQTYGRSLEVADLNGDGVLDIYALQANGTPGCSNCPTNQPDHIYLGGLAAGTYSSGTVGTYETTAAGSGDTVNGIRIHGQTDVIVGNGANLASGPLQLWAWQP